VTDSDLIARGIAGAALLLTILQMWLTSRRARWTRRASTSAELRQTLKELDEVLENAAHPPGTSALWAPTTTARLGVMVEEASEVGDRILHAATTRVYDEIVTLRGLFTPTESDLLSNAVALTATQETHLKSARSSLHKARERVAKARRKGGAK
jgi:hypothetical protein